MPRQNRLITRNSVHILARTNLASRPILLPTATCVGDSIRPSKGPGNWEIVYLRHFRLLKMATGNMPVVYDAHVCGV